MNSLSVPTATRCHAALCWFGKRLAAGLVLVLAASLAQAHTGAELESGFISGFAHPLLGLDHLLAMVAVGIWGATLGRPLVWALPVVFPLLMVVGGVLGIAGVDLPYVQAGIAISVIVLGIAIAAAWRAPIALAVAIVAMFGIFHGFSHGQELAKVAAPAAYATGFVISTGLLHLAGIGIGLFNAVPRGAQLLRASGGLIAATGMWLLAGMPSFVG